MLLYEEIRNISLLISPPIPHYPPPRTTTHSAYERSVGFASIAIVVICGRCILHRLGSTTYKHPCLNSGRSISGILARPLPKGAGLRQGLLVSNTPILRDINNAQILQTLSAVKTEGSPPRFSPFPQTPPTPHYPIQRKTGQRFFHRYPVLLLTFAFNQSVILPRSFR